MPTRPASSADLLVANTKGARLLVGPFCFAAMRSFRALNLIDAVFANDSAVREAWTRYLTALNDASLSVGPGFAIREEKRRDLLLEIVKALGLRRS